MAEDFGIAAEARRLLQGTEVFAGLSQSARRRQASYAQERFSSPANLCCEKATPERSSSW